MSVGLLSSNNDFVYLELPQKCNLPDPTFAAVLSRVEINLKTVKAAICEPQEVILIFPFPLVAGSLVKEAVENLPLCCGSNSLTYSTLVQRQEERSYSRHNYSTITLMDQNSQQPPHFVKDVIMDFLMQWMSRNLSI
jgi:hypothetical protein